jgi:hypothetical protein
MNVFIAGPRAIKTLDKVVEERLRSIFEKKLTVLVGDANGIDTAVQRYYSRLEYSEVIVYASEGKARNNVGSWEVRNVAVEENAKGFDYYAAKDLSMSIDADYGFMIWNGESKGTLNNIINLVSSNKTTVVYLAWTESFFDVDSMDKLRNLIALCGQGTQKLFDRLSNHPVRSIYQQVSLF